MTTTIGTSMIPSVLLPMVNKAGSVVLDQRDVMVNIISLQITLHAVNKILQEAEERQRGDIHVRESLRELVDFGYEARDVLDEFLTAVSINANTTSRSVMFDCLPLIAFFLRCFGIGGSSGTVQVVLPFKLRFRLANDIKSIRKRLDEIMVRREIVMISKDVGEGGFRSVPESPRPESSAFAKKQRNFVGREHKNVKEEIMKNLLDNNDKSIHVAVICGMGGVGKTTLAQSIYNDYPTKNKHWLCVGEKEFTAKEIMLKIINERDIDNIQRTLEKLVHKLRGDRFLIVLDDIWKIDSSEWKLLWNPLTNVVGNGGMIIITTRMKGVITRFNTQVLYELKPLSHEDCWSIFESYAFADGKSDTRQDLEGIGREIVEKLQGHPLAAEVVGRSLYGETDLEIWKQFANLNALDDVRQALRWSYNRLPPHLKQCFVYCSLFPKDHVFDEKLLVEMWMAHDLIQNAGGVFQRRQRRPEDVGAQYLNDLVNASLFECIDDKYVMHDVIHDLALHFSNEEFATTNGFLSTDQMEKARHITINDDDDYMKKLSLCKSKRILTLYTEKQCKKRIYEGVVSRSFNDIVEEVLKNLKSIRVLVLCSSKITDIPNCIGELIHLRYLDVKETEVKSLPDSLCNLHNLQMLAAPLEAVLPKDIVNVHSLRYIRANLPTCRGVGKLTSLQELSSISVCEDDNIGVLGNMEQLQGTLTIKGLENITNQQDAVEALMEKMKRIDELTLVFDRDLRNAATISALVLLNALRCPPKLTHLKIVGYDDPELPRWIADGMFVANVQRLDLSQCNRLEFLVDLGEMRSLEDLRIINCKKLPAVCFPTAIKTLEIGYCGKLTKIELGSLPSLRRLNVQNCDELISISGLVVVEDLNLKGCVKLKSASINFQALDSIERLSIMKCPLLELKCDSSSSSSTLLSSSPWSRLQSLETDNESIFRNIFEQELTIDGEIMEKSLKYLCISSCSQLQSLPTGCLPHSLQRLIIHNCPQLQSLPADGLPPFLRYLFISGCPLLYERCKYESGLDWHKIKHIPQRSIDP